MLPSCFEKARFGFQHGALEQWRGPFGTHVREYETYYLIHRDIADPEVSGDFGISHVMLDVVTPSKLEKHSSTMAKLHASLQRYFISKEQERLTGKQRELATAYSSRIGRAGIRFQTWIFLNIKKFTFMFSFLSTVIILALLLHAYNLVGWEGALGETMPISFQSYFALIIICMFVFWTPFVYACKFMRCRFYDKRTGVRECGLYPFWMFKEATESGLDPGQLKK